MSYKKMDAMDFPPLYHVVVYLSFANYSVSFVCVALTLPYTTEEHPVAAVKRQRNRSHFRSTERKISKLLSNFKKRLHYLKLFCLSLFGIKILDFLCECNRIDKNIIYYFYFISVLLYVC